MPSEGITVDDALWPLVLVTFRSSATDADWRAMFKRYEGFYARREPFHVVNDGISFRIVFVNEEVDSFVFREDPAESKDVSAFISNYLDKIFMLQKLIYGEEFERQVAEPTNTPKTFFRATQAIKRVAVTIPVEQQIVAGNFVASLDVGRGLRSVAPIFGITGIHD